MSFASPCVRAALAAALIFGAASAQAGPFTPACMDPTDVPETVYQAVVAQTGVFFPLQDTGVCGKIVKAAVAACHKAVSDAVSCSSEVYGGVLKAGKAACGTTGSSKSCTADIQSSTDQDDAAVEALGNSADQACDGDLAAALAAACQNGLPT